MGLEQVKEGILAEGRAAAEEDLARAREEAHAIRDRAQQRAEEVRAAKQAELQVAAEALKRRALALAELEAKKLRLQAQKELLARVRAQALERIAKLPSGKNEEFLAVLLKRAGIEDARALARPEDRAVVEKLGFKVAGPLQAVGGVVVESADGATREDLRFENLLEEAWRDALGEVASELFGKG